MDQSSDIEKRIEALESWKKSLVHRWGLALFVVAVAGVFFQLQSCRIDSRIASLDEQIKARAGELAKIEAAAKAAEQTAGPGNAPELRFAGSCWASQRACLASCPVHQESRLALTEIKTQSLTLRLRPPSRSLKQESNGIIASNAEHS